MTCAHLRIRSLPITGTEPWRQPRRLKSRAPTCLRVRAWRRGDGPGMRARPMAFIERVADVGATARSLGPRAMFGPSRNAAKRGFSVARPEIQGLVSHPVPSPFLQPAQCGMGTVRLKFFSSGMIARCAGIPGRPKLKPGRSSIRLVY